MAVIGYYTDQNRAWREVQLPSDNVDRLFLSFFEN